MDRGIVHRVFQGVAGHGGIQVLLHLDGDEVTHTDLTLDTGRAVAGVEADPTDDDAISHGRLRV